MLVNLGGRHPIETLQPVVDGAAVAAAGGTGVGRARGRHAARLHRGAWSRPRAATPICSWAPAPAASLALYRAAQARPPWTAARYVLPDDMQALAPLALPHRCIVRPESALRGRTAAAIVAEMVEKTPLDLGSVE